jgi:hypothetical protein
MSSMRRLARESTSYRCRDDIEAVLSRGSGLPPATRSRVLTPAAAITFLSRGKDETLDRRCICNDSPRGCQRGRVERELTGQAKNGAQGRTV